MINTGQDEAFSSLSIPEQSVEPDHGKSIDTESGEDGTSVDTGNSHSAVFPIEELPQELVRMIVGSMPWSKIPSLRATSRQLKELVDERIWTPHTNPLVTEIMYEEDKSYDDPYFATYYSEYEISYTISLCLPLSNQVLFELRMANKLELARLWERTSDNDENNEEV
ncbi:hypothetical protein PMAYCL1PPCAC_27420, partial [Pristionchus mayeri]